MLSKIAVVRSVPRVPLPSRRGVGTTAVPMGAPSERRLATLDSFPPAAHEIAGVQHDPAVKEDEENRQSHCPVAAE